MITDNTLLRNKLPGSLIISLEGVPKKVDWAKLLNRHSSKSIWVIKLSFCQNDPPMWESFWQKDSLIILILFELCLFRYLAQSIFFFRDTLYLYFEHQMKQTNILLLWTSFMNIRWGRGNWLSFTSSCLLAPDKKFCTLGS